MPKPAFVTYRASDAEPNSTLAAALRHWSPEESWSRVRHWISSRRVLVNGNLCLDSGRRLKPTDVVRLLTHPTAALPSHSDVKIRHIDAHLVVIEKPSGMTSVRHVEERQWSPKRKQANPTLEEILPRVIAERDKSKKPLRPIKGRGVPRKTSRPTVLAVHRLDRDTSGLMVFARTAAAERILSAQFRQHTTDRHYFAVVDGRMEATRIESTLVRDRGDGRRGSGAEGEHGKHAVTHVTPVEFFDGYTLVECRLETGRTHQIRIHVSEQGHPVCGDKVYRGRRRKIADPSGAPRLALHAASLTFTHPISGEQLSFRAPLPADLTEFVERLRNSRIKGRLGGSKPSAEKGVE